jgi:hypothetical protein
MWVRVYFEDWLTGHCRYIYTGRPLNVWRTWWWQTFHRGQVVRLRHGHHDDERAVPQFAPVRRIARAGQEGA